MYKAAILTNAQHGSLVSMRSHAYAVAMFSSLASRIGARPNLAAVLFLLVLSFCTYVLHYAHPSALFWDENYHIASAQKYLNGVYFMEPHPPLGKLFIALGEAIVHPNEENNQFIGTDYAKDPPPGFSFAGYRLFPVLFAWFSVPIFFWLLLLLLRRTIWALLFSLLLVFDNALIVHMRSAMLESTLVFFSLLALLAFVQLMQKTDNQNNHMLWAAILGGAVGAAVTTKVFALIFALLVPFLLFAYRKKPQQFVRIAAMGLGSFLLIFVTVWQIHFTLGRNIQPSLPDNGYYQASPQYKALLQYGKTDSLFGFPWMIRDSINFVGHYQRGVPRLDLCKSDENGSPWFFWPFGARTINYRWESPTSYATRYLYLVPNPVSWTFGLVGIAGALLLLLAPLVVEGAKKPRNATMLLTFLTLYICFMIAVSRIDRVMYLYHYFLPLIFSFTLFALVCNEIKQIGAFRLTEERRTWLYTGIAMLVFAGFQFMRPFTYYDAISDSAVQHRALLRVWDLNCVRCNDNRLLVVPSA